MPVTIDKPLPDFSTPATSGITFSPASQRGKIVVLYSYPKDNAPGYTTEAMNFRDQYDAFEAAGVVVFGISRDSLKSYENFKARPEMPFELISDAGEAVCNVFDTTKMKKTYGKDVRDIERSTSLIDSKGVLRKEWRGAKVPNHVDDVLAAVRAL